MFNERIATLKEQLAAYKEKLAGASPDEVASKIASLEKRLDSNLPTVVPIEDVNRFGDHEASQRHRLIPPREQRGITISRNLPQAWRSHFHGPRSDLVELLGNAAT